MTEIKYDSLISVIVPVYNVAEILLKSLDSILCQTYRNLEIILIDDGSTDESGQICDDAGEKDSRIIVIHKRNGGLSSARNAGIKIANGECLLFVDSDDWLESNMIEVLLSKLIKDKSDLAICGIYVTDGLLEAKMEWFQEDCIMDGKDALEALINNDIITSHAWNKLYRRELFDNIEFPHGKLYEDVRIMHRIFERCKCISICSEYGYYYFQRKQSITNNQSFQRKLEYIESFATRYYDLIDQYPEYKEILIKNIVVSSVLVLSQGSISSAEKKKYSKEIKDLLVFLKDKDVKNSVKPLLDRKKKALYILVLMLGTKSYSVYKLKTLMMSR